MTLARLASGRKIEGGGHLEQRRRADVRAVGVAEIDKVPAATERGLIEGTPGLVHEPGGRGGERRPKPEHRDERCQRAGDGS